VNVQVVTDLDGRLLWISPALPSRAHDLTVGRTHRIVRICERQGVPVLADRAYRGAGPWVTTLSASPEPWFWITFGAGSAEGHRPCR
jgi:hypothetical protein